MTTERETTAMTDLKPVWPDFIAPPKYDNPDPRWVDPALPDFRLIWKVARECGYAVGLHGSMKRDCDLIAVPWTDEAVLAFDLIDHLCTALNAKVVGPVAGKPHGRLGWNLQVDGYVKVIDISVVPRSQDRAAPDLKRIGTGLYETQSDYRLAPHLQRIVDAAKSAPQWDTQADRLAPTDAAQDDDLECTDCGGTGITYQTERVCTCQPTDAAQARAPFFFDRYINGVQMAEGVCIERETTLEGAMQAAVRIAAKGPKGEAPVLVYRARAALTTEADNDRQA